jgi:type IV pilus assembly protein PilC
MAKFNYRARDQEGKIVSGVVEARSDRDAVTLLREQGLLVVDLTPSGGGLSLSFLTDALQHVSFGDVVDFTRQLATMITSGLTLTDSLSVLTQQTRNPAFARVLDEIYHEIEVGNNFANALEKFPQHFSKIYIALVRAGEASGMLDKVLTRLADNLEKQREFNGKIKGAMIYPAIVVCGMIGVVFIMMTFVIPQMTAIYEDFGGELPLATKILIATSKFFVKYWYLILAGLAGAIFAFRGWRKTPVGRRMLDAAVLEIPIIGKLEKEIILVEFTRTLGLLVGAGLPILEALNIVSEALGNVLYEEGIKDAAQKVEKGFPLGVPLAQNPDFPPILGQMIKVGEETGKLDDSLLKLSRYFEIESEEMVKGLTQALEPIIMVVLGLGVAFLVLAVIMPIYKLTETIK